MKSTKNSDCMFDNGSATVLVADGLVENPPDIKEHSIKITVSASRPSATKWSLIVMFMEPNGVYVRCALSEKQVKALRHALTKSYPLVPTDVTKEWPQSERELFGIKNG